MRKLATIRKIDEIDPIEGADVIEAATVGGWKVVVKRGEFKVGDLAIFCEIDSWIPTELAPFLSKGTEPREFNGVKGERLKTIKLRGQISQGLILPLSVLAVKTDSGSYIGDWDDFVDCDVTERLGIQKWEAPIPAQLSGTVKGNFPAAVPKTDQERIQNLKREFEDYRDCELTFEVTEKLDGSSCTFYLPVEGDFEVCSRNLSLKKDENNSFWKVAIAYDVAQKMYERGLNGYAIQGELIGEGIQKNRYGIRGQDFYVFDIYCVLTGRYLTRSERVELVAELGLKHCPILVERHKFMKSDTVEFILEYAEGKSLLNPKTEREGVVFKCIENTDVSFKAISNKFLLKGE